MCFTISSVNHLFSFRYVVASATKFCSVIYEKFWDIKVLIKGYGIYTVYCQFKMNLEKFKMCGKIVSKFVYHLISDDS